MLASAFGVWFTWKHNQGKLRLEERAEDRNERSVSVQELEALVPGFGEIAKGWRDESALWKAEAHELRAEIAEVRDEAQERQLLDHTRIIELEGQVRALTLEVLRLRRLYEPDHPELT